MSEKNVKPYPVREKETDWDQALIDEEQRIDDEILKFLETNSPKYQAIKRLLYMIQTKSENLDAVITYSYNEPGNDSGYMPLSVEFSKKGIHTVTNSRRISAFEWKKDQKEIASLLIKESVLKAVLTAVLNKETSVRFSIV